MGDSRPESKEIEPKKFYEILKSRGDVGVISGSEFGIPVLYARGRGLAETWENSLLSLYFGGSGAPTQYDRKGDPSSRDATLMMVSEMPFEEPAIHKCFPGGIEDLESYSQEVNRGIRNFRVRDLTDPTAREWEYTYNERLFSYSVPLSLISVYLSQMSDKARRALAEGQVGILLDKPWAKVTERKVRKYDIEEYEKDGEKKIKPVVVGEGIEKIVVINQIEACIDGLTKTPHTRRVQAVTWKVWEDLVAYDPACLQSFWFRILNGKLNMNIRFRSRDSFKAAFMNFSANRGVASYVAQRVSEGRNEQIEAGRIMDISDSYHVYGKDLKDFEELFLGQMPKRTFEERTMSPELVSELREEALPIIAEKVRQERIAKGLSPE